MMGMWKGYVIRGDNECHPLVQAEKCSLCKGDNYTGDHDSESTK